MFWKRGNKMLNFTITELCKSDVARKNNISNIPQQLYIYDNIINLIHYCLQPLRDKLGKPIIISSGYRCQRLNKMVGGSNTSHHIQGMAADFVVVNMKVKEVINYIINSGQKWTQLIEEHANGKVWVHISYNPKDLKCEVLKYENGKYIK